METDLNDLRSRPIIDLVRMAHEASIEKATSLGRQDLVFEILCRKLGRGSVTRGRGVLEILSDGFGFLRAIETGYQPGADDIYVSPSQIRRFHLRTGDMVVGRVRAPKDNERYFALIKVELVNGYDPELQDRPLLFDNLTPTHPDERLRLESGEGLLAPRVADLFYPMGRGQRVLLEAPPRSGRDLFFGQLVQALAQLRPECHLLRVQLQARPEQITELRRNQPCELVATSFEEGAARHAQAATIACERARRLAEAGDCAVLLLDSLTALCRAQDELAGGTARLGSGGLEAHVLNLARHVLSSARNLEGAGSLTVIASLVTDKGNPLDEAVAAALRGTANCHIVLEPGLCLPGQLPGFDLCRGGSLHEDKLLSAKQRASRRDLRSSLGADPVQALHKLHRGLLSSADNAALLDRSRETGE